MDGPLLPEPIPVVPVVCNSATTTLRCCGGRNAICRARCYSKASLEGIKGARCEALQMKILLRLRSEPVMAALVGVIPILGGVTEKC
jgi:hypothetical protein